MEIRYQFLVDEMLTTAKLDNEKTRGYFGIRLENVLYTLEHILASAIRNLRRCDRNP